MTVASSSSFVYILYRMLHYTQVPQIHETTTKRVLNDSSSQPKRNLKRPRLVDAKRLMHSKNRKKKLVAPSVDGRIYPYWNIVQQFVIVFISFEITIKIVHPMFKYFLSHLQHQHVFSFVFVCFYFHSITMLYSHSSYIYSSCYCCCCFTLERS